MPLGKRSNGLFLGLPVALGFLVLLGKLSNGLLGGGVGLLSVVLLIVLSVRIGILKGEGINVFENEVDLFMGLKGFLSREVTIRYEVVDGVAGFLFVDSSVLADVGKREEILEVGVKVFLAVLFLSKDVVDFSENFFSEFLILIEQVQDVLLDDLTVDLAIDVLSTMEFITDLFGLLAAEAKEFDGTLKFGLIQVTITVGVGLSEELVSDESEKFLLSIVGVSNFVDLVKGERLTISELGVHLSLGFTGVLSSEVTGLFEAVDGVVGLLPVDEAVPVGVGEVEDSVELEILKVLH